MQEEEEPRESVPLPWGEAPCSANVWDDRIQAYRPCDETANAESDFELCTKHYARLTSILSLINAAQSTARAREVEEAAPPQREGRSRPCSQGSSLVGGRDEHTARD
jgi:hypothetical protein